MSGALLGHLSQADALVLVARAFDDPNVPHVEGAIDPARDIETLQLELLFSDLAAVEKRLERIENQKQKAVGRERDAMERERALMEQLRQALETETPIREILPEIDPEDLKILRGFGFLTAKPLLILLNLGEDQLGVAESSTRCRVPGAVRATRSGSRRAAWADRDGDWAPRAGRCGRVYERPRDRRVRSRSGHPTLVRVVGVDAVLYRRAG